MSAPEGIEGQKSEKLVFRDYLGFYHLNRFTNCIEMVAHNICHKFCYINFFIRPAVFEIERSFTFCLYVSVENIF